MRKRHTLVVTTREVDATWRDAAVVRTMLDMISSLERASVMIATVVLGGEFARDRDIAAFLRETYPAIEVVVARGPGVAALV